MSCVLRGIERGVRKLGLGGRRNLGLSIFRANKGEWVVGLPNPILTPKFKKYVPVGTNTSYYTTALQTRFYNGMQKIKTWFAD